MSQRDEADCVLPGRPHPPHRTTLTLPAKSTFLLTPTGAVHTADSLSDDSPSSRTDYVFLWHAGAECLRKWPAILAVQPLPRHG